MSIHRSRKYSQGYGTVLVALIGAAGVAGTIGYEARLQGQTGERNESLKGYLQARELASERVMMMLTALEKAAVTPVTLQGVNAASADMAIVQNSPNSLEQLSSQSGVNFASLGQQLGAEVEATSGFKNASLELNTRMLGAQPRVLRDAHGIPVSLEYTLRVKGKGYYFCPAAGSKTGCATGEAAADLRWKVPLQVAALPVTPPSVTPTTTTGTGTPITTGSTGGGGGSGSDPCAALAPQNSDPNTTSASSVAIATNTGTLTCTSGNVGAGGGITVGGNATNGQGTSNTQGSATHGSNNINSTTTGSGSFAGNTTTNGNGTQTQSSGNAGNVHNMPAATTSTTPVVGSSSGKYYQATLSGSQSNRALHPWEQ